MSEIEDHGRVPGVTRRTLAKASVWSAPVVAAVAAAPLATASPLVPGDFSAQMVLSGPHSATTTSVVNPATGLTEPSFSAGDTLVYTATYCNLGPEIIWGGPNLAISFTYTSQLYKMLHANDIIYDTTDFRNNFKMDSTKSMSLKQIYGGERGPIRFAYGDGEYFPATTTYRWFLDDPVLPGECFDVTYSLTYGDFVFQENSPEDIFTIFGDVTSTRVVLWGKGEWDYSNNDAAINSALGNVTYRR